MLQCRPLHWWRGNLKPPINSCSPVKLPSGPEWRTPSPSSGPGPNLFQREVMKKLIISNEELAIEARRNDCQHCAEESKRSPGRPCAKLYSLGNLVDFLDLLWAANSRSNGLIINPQSCRWKFCMVIWRFEVFSPAPRRPFLIQETYGTPKVGSLAPESQPIDTRSHFMSARWIIPIDRNIFTAN